MIMRDANPIQDANNMVFTIFVKKSQEIEENRTLTIAKAPDVTTLLT